MSKWVHTASKALYDSSFQMFFRIGSKNCILPTVHLSPWSFWILVLQAHNFKPLSGNTMFFPLGCLSFSWALSYLSLLDLVNEKCCLPYQQTKDAAIKPLTAILPPSPSPRRWALRELRMETKGLPTATPSATAVTHSPHHGAPWGDSGWERTGYWP